MKLGIYYSTNQAKAEAERLLSLSKRLGANAELFCRAEEIGGVDRLVVLGGDGTMLRAAKHAAALGIPLVGVNFGRVGFLTEFEKEDGEAAVRLAVSGGETVSRTMLEISFKEKKAICLNECAVLHSVTPQNANRLSRIGVAIDGSAAGDFFADGLIVATPTGSTAYSLSAGGCIVTPDCASFLLTPVCAFSMRSRPIVFSDKCTLTVSNDGDGRELLVYGDGQFLWELHSGDEVTVRRAPLAAQFLTGSRSGFFTRLTEKIN